MARQYFIPGHGMMTEEPDLIEYFLPGYGMVNLKHVASSGWGINNLEVAIEIGSVVMVYHGFIDTINDLEVATEIGQLTLTYHAPGGPVNLGNMFLVF